MSKDKINLKLLPYNDDLSQLEKKELENNIYNLNNIYYLGSICNKINNYTNSDNHYTIIKDDQNRL